MLREIGKVAQAGANRLNSPELRLPGYAEGEKVDVSAWQGAFDDSLLTKRCCVPGQVVGFQFLPRGYGTIGGLGERIASDSFATL